MGVKYSRYNPVFLMVGAAMAVLLSGCMPKVPTPRLPERPKTAHRSMWSNTSTIERNYSLKPEPYSLDSKEGDPELLGPQSTLQKPLPGSDGDGEMPENTAEAAPSPAGETASARTSPSPASGMSKNRCIELIGRNKFEEYTRRFGSESAALRKCLILERVQRNQ